MKPDILIKQLHEKAQTLARELKRAEAELIDILQKLDEKKFSRNLGYTSLFDYCVKCLGLSESVSYNLITVARKSVQVPELKEAISQGKVTLSKAKKMTAAINKTNPSEWIAKAQILIQKAERVLERALNEKETAGPKDQQVQPNKPQAPERAATQNCSQELLRGMSQPQSNKPENTLRFWEEGSIQTHRQPMSPCYALCRSS